MQFWEYLTITSVILDHKWRVVWSNAESYEADNAPFLRDYMDELGKQGWELVSEISEFHNSDFHSLMYEKRQRDNETKLQELSASLEANGREIISVTSFSWGDLLGTWLIHSQKRYRILRFKREKSNTLQSSD